MGIRFWCPNGHKLNVKSFQAGRRGICPYCGARFQIPAESTRKPGAQDLAPEPQEHSVHEGISGLPPATAPNTPASPSPDAAAAAPGPLASGPLSSPMADVAGPLGTPSVAAEAGTTQPDPGQSAPIEQVAPPGPATDPQAAFQSAPAAPSGPPSAGAPADPLTEAPDAVWYVRPPTGGQFGPATADVMLNWIGEGRVSPDSMVWREGWRDWQEATATFPQLGDDTPAFSLGNFGGEPSGTPATQSVAHSGRSKAVNAAIIVALLLAVVLLFGVFLYVAFGPKDEEEPSTGTARTPSTLLQQHHTTAAYQQHARPHV